MSRVVGLLVLVFVVLVGARWWADLQSGLLRLGGHLEVLAIVCLYRVVPIGLNAVSWQVLFPLEWRLPLRSMLRFRWIGEAINGLLPAAQVGGDVARARLVTLRGVPTDVAGATLVVDMSTSLVTQAVFTLMGIAALRANATGGPAVSGTTSAALAVVVVLLASVAILLVAPRLARLGPGGLGARPPAWRILRTVRALGRRFVTATAALNVRLGELWRRRARIAASLLGHLFSWVAQTFETYLLFWSVGARVSVTQALAIESLSFAARSAAFVVPGGLGVQEGAVVFVAHQMGVPTDTAIAVALGKRFRELLVGVPGLLSWAASERRALRVVGP